MPSIYLNDRYPSCFLIECEQQYFKLRVSSGFNTNAVSCEINALQILSPILDSMVPRIIESNTESVSQSFIIENFLPGKSIDKLHEKELVQYSNIISEQLSYFLKRLYHITATGYGELDAPFYETYKEWLLNKLSVHILYHREMGFISNNTLNKIYDLFNNTTVFKETSPHFLHFDIKPQNLIFCAELQQLFVVDFEFSRFGDVEHELFRAERKSSRYPIFADKILSPVIKQYLISTHKTLLEEKKYLFSIYYDLSELTYLLKRNEYGKVKTILKSLKKQLSEI